MCNQTLLELLGCREDLVTRTDNLLVRCTDVGYVVMCWCASQWTCLLVRVTECGTLLW